MQKTNLYSQEFINHILESHNHIFTIDILKGNKLNFITLCPTNKQLDLKALCNNILKIKTSKVILISSNEISQANIKKTKEILKCLGVELIEYICFKSN